MSQAKHSKTYDQYLILRNYDPAAGKLVILKRALIDSWFEAGFHRFWQVWNPGIGYLLYSLYRRLGGNQHRLVASMIVFTLSGFLHDLAVMLIFRRQFVAFTAAFILFGALALLNRTTEPCLRQDRLPRWVNAIWNLGNLAASIVVAVQLQMRVFP